MAEVVTLQPVKFFIALLANPADQSEINRVIMLLNDKYGAIDFASCWYPFDCTNYYQPEMGANLYRRFVSFEQLMNPDELAPMKTFTNQLENDFSHHNKRKVNLDCGYLDYYKVVLASVKFAGQKIYLGNGIYADMVLYYVKGNYEPFFWTFPDFKRDTYFQLLREIRLTYKHQLRKKKY